MGNFAENLNLGNRFRPPPPKITACALDVDGLLYSSPEPIVLLV